MPYVVAAAVAAVIISFVCGFVIGRRQGYQIGLHARSEFQLGAIREQAHQPAVLDLGKQTVESPGPGGPRTSEKSAGPERRPSVAAGGKTSEITRNKELNYLRIHSFGTLSSAERAQAFLAAKGVQTTIERDRNWYVLYSALGFDRNDAKQREDADQFEQLVKAIGQQYRREPNAEGVDFKTCMFYRWEKVLQGRQGN